MKTPYKALGFVLSVVLYHMIQTSRNNKIVASAYSHGVRDGIVIEKNNAKVRSRNFEEAIMRAKYGKFAKVVE